MKRHLPTMSTRAIVASMALWSRSAGIREGFTQEDIARKLQLDVDTLKKHYSEELAIGPVNLKQMIFDRNMDLMAEGNAPIALHLLKSVGGVIATEKVEQEQSITVNVMVQAKQAALPVTPSLVYENQNSSKVITQQSNDVLAAQPLASLETEK